MGLRLRNIRILSCMELKKLWNDKLELLILLFGAVLLSLAFGYVAHTNPRNIDIVVFTDSFSTPDLFPREETRKIIDDLKGSSSFSVTYAHSLEEAVHQLNSLKARAVLILEEDSSRLARVQVMLDVTDRTIMQTVKREILQILQSRAGEASVEAFDTRSLPLQPAEMSPGSPLSLRTQTNEWQATKLFDGAASPFIVLIILGVCLLTSVTVVTTERTSGTFERILAVPFTRSDIVLSKTLARSLVAVAASLIVMGTLKLVFDITMARPGLAVAAAILIGINGVAFGILISSVTRVELESVSLGITSWFLFITLMGFMWPLETMHPLFQRIAFLTPYFYGVQAMRHVNLLGWGLGQVLPSLMLLAAFIGVQLLFSILLLKREIK